MGKWEDINDELYKNLFIQAVQTAAVLLMAMKQCDAVGDKHPVVIGALHTHMRLGIVHIMHTKDV